MFEQLRSVKVNLTLGLHGGHLVLERDGLVHVHQVLLQVTLYDHI